MPEYDVCGLGNPLVDILVHVKDEFLAENGLNKGIMHLIEKDERKKLLHLLRDAPKQMEAGGDCPNTIAALAMLGARSAFTGKVGKDELGTIFEQKMQHRGVHSFLRKCDADTGTSIILITPDRERTMNTCLSACRKYGRDDIPAEVIENSGFFYVTGYMWDTESQKDACRYALSIAKKKGVRIAFDAADPFAAGRYRDEFIGLIKEDVDVLFSNAHEARILTGLDDIEEGLRTLGKLCPIAVIKNGAKDTLICSGWNVIRVPSFKTKAVDTTGAGDNFAAGFLYGLLKDFTLDRCGLIASFVASKSIEKIGAQAPENIRELVEKMLQTKP